MTERHARDISLLAFIVGGGVDTANEGVDTRRRSVRMSAIDEAGEACAMIEWTKLHAVYEFARHSGVVLTLNYVDVTDDWYFTIESVSAGENWIGKPTSFDAAVADVVAWLRRLARMHA